MNPLREFANMPGSLYVAAAALVPVFVLAAGVKTAAGKAMAAVFMMAAAFTVDTGRLAVTEDPASGELELFISSDATE